ncbi:MAG: alpha/beta fold hydrolase, partial [Dietzia cercidiphylli]
MSFLLVHGAGMGATSWERLIPHLNGPAVAVDLPGRGARAHVDLRS